MACHTPPLKKHRNKGKCPYLASVSSHLNKRKFLKTVNKKKKTSKCMSRKGGTGGGTQRVKTAWLYLGLDATIPQ